jgi:hypothetical protein
MSHEVLVLANGELFTATEMVYSEWTRHQESYPCLLPNGKEGQAQVTVDTAELRFTASAGSIQEGDTGQLSTGEDRFHEVTILSVEEAGNGLLIVSARARKKVGWKFPDPDTEP